MIIVRLLSPEPVGWFCHHQLYSGLGADIVMESITLIDPEGGFECYGLWLFKNSFFPKTTEIWGIENVEEKLVRRILLQSQ
jgi:hypothetical protein